MSSSNSRHGRHHRIPKEDPEAALEKHIKDLKRRLSRARTIYMNGTTFLRATAVWSFMAGIPIFFVALAAKQFDGLPLGFAISMASVLAVGGCEVVGVGFAAVAAG